MTAVGTEIQNLTQAYAIFSPLTNMPYIECEEINYNDQVYLFAKKDDAESFVKNYAEKGIVLKVQELKTQEVYIPVKADQPDGEKKKMYLNEVRQHLGILPFLGVNAVGYQSFGSDLQSVELKDILPEGFEKRLDGNQMYQPNLQLTGLYLMQEARRNKEYVTMKQIQELDEEFSSNLVKAGLFIAVLPPEGFEKNPQLNLKDCRMPYLKHQSGDVFFPLFTDVWEFQKYARNNKALRPIWIPFKDITKFWVQDAKAYMINPLGYSLPLAKDMIPKILARFGVVPTQPEQK
ncbi:MAG: SseB family protein [Lachnospiraceae bacterium]|nr:SseB family protein [Lachnospiraceae bacterium]